MNSAVNELSAWIPSGLLLLAGIALFAFRNGIKTWVNSSIQHRFDTNIETIRSEHTKQIEQLKSELRAKGDQIAALRDGALSSLASRRVALDKRRMEAVEKLWACTISLAPLKSMSTQMKYFKFETAAKRAINEPKLRQLFEIIGQGVDPSKLLAAEAPKEQPFLSTKAWALFSAYRTILHYAFSQVMVLKTGLDPSDLFDHKNINEIIKTALPEYSDYIDTQGPVAYHYLVETLEQKLLSELQRSLSGAEESTEAVKEAANILAAVNTVEAEIDASKRQ